MKKTTKPLKNYNCPPPQANTGAAGLFNRLHTAIINGEYAFNTKLPSERELAEQYALARGTVRATIDQLETAQMVKKKFASGAYVCYDARFEPGNMAEQISPLELIETRLAIEPHIVRLVVANANHRDLRHLEQALEAVVAVQSDADRFSLADESFHLMLATCSRNPLLIWIYQRINDIRSHTQWSHSKNNILTPDKIAHYNQQHHELVQAIIRRNIDHAVMLMQTHLNQARKDLLAPEHRHSESR